MITDQQYKWVVELRTALQKVATKRKAKGVGNYTYATYRKWFRDHYEYGVKELGIHRLNDDYTELLKLCRIHMKVGDWKTFDCMLKN